MAQGLPRKLNQCRDSGPVHGLTRSRFAREGKLWLADVVTRTVPLDAKAINETLDTLERGGETVHVVTKP